MQHHCEKADIIEVGTAWDCDPDVIVEVDDYDLGLNPEDDGSDWQVVALDRWSDRMLRKGSYWE